MKTMIRPAFRRAMLLAGFTAMLCTAASRSATPCITTPIDGARITAPHVDVRVSVAGVQNVQTVEIVADGKTIGYASPTSFFGEWSFPDGSHVSILAGIDGNVKIDYTPPNGATMYLIEGAMTGENTFTGTFIHWPGGGITLEGDVNATFSFTGAGLLKIVLQGDQPLGNRTITGGVSDHSDYHFAWNNPPQGRHSLVARIAHLPSGTPPAVILVTTTVNITVALPPAPEIVVQQPKGSDLTDGVSKRGFGTTRIGNGGLTRVFVIKNAGSAKLKGLAITKNGAHAKDFIITGPTATSLAAGTATTFKVTFRPTGAGVRNAAIHVRSNDADENPFDIKLSGQAVKP